LSAIGAGAQRRRRLVTRTLPIIALASGAFVAGIVVAAGPDAPAVGRFLDAWERREFEAMHAELTADAKGEFPLEEFERIYSETETTASTTSLEAGDVDEEGDVASARITLRTHAFGTLAGELRLPLSDSKIEWAPHLAFPGLRDGELLSRSTRAPRRAPILAADGTPLAEGPAAARTITSSAALAVVGELGTPEGERAEELAAQGFAPGTPAGISGLELAFDERLAGQPGGQLIAAAAAEESELGGGRVLAASQPVPGRPVRTTIDPAVQEAAVIALGGTYGGVAVLDARRGSVLGLAGLAYSAPQPPGSTFKIITTTAALDAGAVELDDEFPVEVSNSEIGREIENAGDAPCGGTFVDSFANSCNTVFAPLGVEVGGEKLVETAESFGFNSPPTLFDREATGKIDPPASTLPETLESSVEIGETAIGQGQVLATPLEMASVAQTIANRGVRMPTAMAKPAALRPNAGPVEVTTPEIATTIRNLMIEVVRRGTGTAAAVPGIEVAGKTGTAEIGPAPLDPGQELAPGEDPPQEQDAWFAAFAPAEDPKLAIAVMVVNAEGGGGDVAAPIAQQVLAATLG
jgi:cell division protein FtsI/penicillin-binding protein 2